METADIGTQTKRSALKAHSNKSVKMKAEEVIETENIKSCEFEVFGIVQDVSFRHYTLRRAQKLNIHGWCMNSEYGTVVGLIQGSLRSFEAMRLWLTYTGSPTSRIDKCVFGPTLDLENFTFDEFTIRI
ncbi:acylphosphatase-2 isoform X1 [Drosophila innubila]|uniref:acylphosphatase-2 isoform X1 n=1 Tax=Drosophila innubila TaxID=198719 RepID=UPI00148C4BDB|nr:acylphosphatase-2 isoform X1 [Drosophila innubila]